MTFLLRALVLPLLLVLAACGGSDETEKADHNAADIAFAQAMVPHHHQALEMAELAERQQASPEVRDLADRIAAAQGPEIEQMSQWLEGWGEHAHEEGAHGDDHMDGMMTSAQMEELSGATGAAFDRLFLTMMIEHHEGAVAMAREAQADGAHAGTIALAKRVEEAQLAEIDEMETLLGQ